MLNNNEKKEIYNAFKEGSIKVLSSTKNKKLEWKTVQDVTRHDVSNKIQYKISLENGVSCTATEDHSLFKDAGDSIKEWKTGDFSVGSDIVFVENNKVVTKKVSSNIIVPSEKYMYDLTVEDNQNFVLKSGILAHNTFRPPSSEKFLQAQAQVFGYIWEDEELYEYLLMAVDDFNTAPPVTGIVITNIPDRWRTAILIRAAAFACFAVAMTWVANEFAYSISGVSLDIQKSQSYSNMKDGFTAEYDKLKEQAKASIKIVMGLKQPRYGIGISSALGPYSRPGIQSRSNFVSGFRGGWA